MGSGATLCYIPLVGHFIVVVLLDDHHATHDTHAASNFMVVSDAAYPVLPLWATGAYRAYKYDSME